MSSINIAGDSSGAITLTVPAVAGTNTVTIPASTGTVMVSGNMPAFSSYNNATQNITSATWTKVQFNIEEFDTNNCFDSTTNYRFTPTVAGYYQINAVVAINGTLMTQVISAIYKNGGEYKRGNQISLPTGVTNGISSLTCAVIYFNGSTDYVEIYGLGVGTSPSFISGGASSVNCSFNGSMVRGA